MLASYFGLTSHLSNLLESRSDVGLQHRDEIYGRSALSWAAENGSKRVVDLLIKSGCGRLMRVQLPRTRRNFIDSLDRHNRSPLFYAIRNRHVDIIKALLKAGARVDLKDDLGATPLSYALLSGGEVVKLLFKDKSKEHLKEEVFSELLSHAASRGQEDIVGLLIETDQVNINLKSGYPGSPLSSAAANGHEGVVRLLLKKGADIESRDDFKRTPLSRAVMNGHEGVVQLLLSRNPGPHSCSQSQGVTEK
ncbi:Inversin [Dactylella cylindrospora]|nr:Inversin [Dactylella cylindrospora]